LNDRRRPRDTYTRYRSATANGIRTERIGVREEEAGTEERDPFLLQLGRFLTRCTLTAAVWFVAACVWTLAFHAWGWSGGLVSWCLLPVVMSWLDGRANSLRSLLYLWPGFFVYTLLLVGAGDLDSDWLIVSATVAAVAYPGLRIRYG
jgi:hypothetical protein